jgi:hypothetical protein
MRNRDNHNFVTHFTINYLIWEPIHQVKTVSIIAQRKTSRVRAYELLCFVEFRVEAFSGTKTALCIPAKCFGVLGLGRRNNPRFTHRGRPYAVHEHELPARVMRLPGRHHILRIVVAPRRSKLG